MGVEVGLTLPPARGLPMCLWLGMGSPAPGQSVLPEQVGKR